MAPGVDPTLDPDSKVEGLTEKSSSTGTEPAKPVALDKPAATENDVIFSKPLPKPRYDDEKQKRRFAPRLFKSRTAKGAELREPVPSESLKFRPWICICLLRITYETGEKATATGFLINPMMVATSAHVLLNPDFGIAREIEVDPGFLQVEGQISQVARDFRWNREWCAGSFVAKYDYGVIKLPNPNVCAHCGQMTWCGLDAADLQQPLILSGYPGAKPGQRPLQLRHKGNIVDEPGPMSMFHDIMTTEGQSGSPLFFISGSEARVVGIHSKASTDLPGTNVARRVTREMIDDYGRWAQQFGIAPLTS